MARFIPDYTTVTEPTQKLTRQDTKCKWKKHGIQAFTRLKDALHEMHGLLIQERNLNYLMTQVLWVWVSLWKGKVLGYASSTLSNIETRYSQTVKTKRLMREKVWLPEIDRLVGDKIKCSIPCQAITLNPQSREPLTMTTLCTTEECVCRFDWFFPIW